eukprot:GEMP01026513.1.p1 GENE.GEMP01026513.1~~GEMP01026513.1.p1  ORF type:complete len:335 (+),score=67.94 GEMP01026513.1:148-1152(+)
MLLGQLAPDFAAEACLSDNSFTEVTLSSFRGKYVVVFFYSTNFSAVSATEVPGFQKLVGEFTKRSCVVLGIASDTPSSHKVWKMMPQGIGGIGDISYPLLSDPNKEIAEMYDCIMSDGQFARGVFLIDANGVVQAEQRNNLPLGRNLDEVVRLLDALQFHERSVAEGNPLVMPACWTLGQPAIAPTMEGIAQFASEEGGLGRYVMADRQHSTGGHARVIWIPPISESNPYVPITVKMQQIRMLGKEVNDSAEHDSRGVSQFTFPNSPSVVNCCVADGMLIDYCRPNAESRRSNDGSDCMSLGDGFSPHHGISPGDCASPSRGMLDRGISHMWTL